MANLQKIIKVTQEQYDILASGGIVGEYTGLDPNFLYLIKDTNTYITSDGGTINGVLEINGANHIRNTTGGDPLKIFYDNSEGYAIALYPDASATEYYYQIDVEDTVGVYAITLPADSGTLATRDYVQQYVGKPMVFRGTVGTGGTVTWANLPTASNENKGYTYKVITDHTADSKCPACKDGDTIISNGSTWVVIPSGDEDNDTVREIKVNGTTQLNTGISSGYVNFKNGTNTTVSFSNSHDIQINATDTNTQYQLKTYDATATGRIAYLSDVSSSGSNTVSKSTHTHTVTATGSVSLGSSTSTDGVKYVESVTSNPAGKDGKYMHFSAGTTPPSAATPNTTSTTSGANSGTKVTAITGYPNFSGGSLSGDKTFVKGITAGSGALTSVDTQATGDILYATGISGSAPSLGGTKTFNTDAIKSVTLSASTTSTDGPTYVESISGGSAVSPTTKYMKFNAGTTPKSSASFSGTAATITPTLNAGTTKYLSASFSGTAATITPTLTGTKTFVTTALKSASTAGSRTTSGSGTTARRTLTISTSTSSTGSTEQGTVGISGASYTPAGSITLTANDSTATGRITYLQSQGTITGASYTPAGSVSLTAGTAPSMNFNTGTSTDTPYVSSVSGGSAVVPTTKYMKATGTAAGKGTVSISGGSYSATTKYLHHTHTSASSSGTGTVTLTAASLGTPSTGDCAPNAHTHSYDKTTSVNLTAGTAPSITYNSTASGGEYYVTNVTGGGATPTTKYFHPSFSGTSATTSDGSNATATASTGVNKTTKYLNLEEK